MGTTTVHLIGTGGTIAGKLRPSGEITPGLTAKELLELIPTAGEYAHVTPEDFLQVGSGDIGLREMLGFSENDEKKTTAREGTRTKP